MFFQLVLPAKWTTQETHAECQMAKYVQLQLYIYSFLFVKWPDQPQEKFSHFISSFDYVLLFW